MCLLDTHIHSLSLSISLHFSLTYIVYFLLGTPASTDTSILIFCRCFRGNSIVFFSFLRITLFYPEASFLHSFFFWQENAFNTSSYISPSHNKRLPFTRQASALTIVYTKVMIPIVHCHFFSTTDVSLHFK